MKSHAERSAESIANNLTARPTEGPVAASFPGTGDAAAPRALYGPPPKRCLYDPEYEHDCCGVGFVANIKGVRCREIIDDADRILRHLIHRGATGCEANTGDGAGMLTGLPYEFLQKVADADLGVTLPKPGFYGVGNVFLPTNARERRACKETVNRLIAEQGQKMLGWGPRPPRADGADIGPSARAAGPRVEQLFFGGAAGVAGRARSRTGFYWRGRRVRSRRV